VPRVCCGRVDPRNHATTVIELARPPGYEPIANWWWTCPRSNRRARKLYLPISARHFWSRRAYGLAYASQREGGHDRALRRVRKLYHRLGAEPADGELPDKPKRMRWVTYNRLIGELVAADRVADRAAHHPRGAIA